eukprot:3819353-Prymnesium_polylepis.1
MPEQSDGRQGNVPCAEDEGSAHHVVIVAHILPGGVERLRHCNVREQTQLHKPSSSVMSAGKKLWRSKHGTYSN